MYTQRTITKLAINSRILLLCVQVLCNNLLSGYDADAFRYASAKAEADTIDKTVQFIFGGFLRWDAHYFMHIAKHGYTYENTTAFFPFYPQFVRCIGLVFNYIVPLINLDSFLLIVFILLNTISFILAANILYKITVEIFDETVAFKTVMLFCYNPASVFFIAPYTESVFCYVTFKSIHSCLVILKKYLKNNAVFHVNDLSCSLWVGLSTIIRSNGILNIGFLTYTCLCVLFRKSRTNLKELLTGFITISILSALCFLPFVIYQIYCFQRFCTDFQVELPKMIMDDALKNGFILPGQFSKHNQTWCFQSLPLAYSYVQDHYWNVGFLRYYELKQIPNFFVAFPILFIMLSHIIIRIRCGTCEDLFDFFRMKEIFSKRRFEEKIFSPCLNVFVIHALFLTLFSIFFMHIQVSTRLLCSATPVFYWYCAYSLKSHGRIIKIYFATYFILGTIMFSLFLPWT